MRRPLSGGLTIALLVGLLSLVAPVSARSEIPAADVFSAAREPEPVVLTGANFASWAAPANVNAKAPTIDGKRCEGSKQFPGNPVGSSEACTHNTYEDPEISSSDVTNQAGVQGLPTDRLLGYRWTGEAFEEIPLQVDEMAVRYVSNNNSGFSFYSETDQHTTYVFDREGFRWTESDPDNPCLAHPASEVLQDPVAGLDTDDEVVFMAKDAAEQAPEDEALPAGIEASYEVAVTDPLTGDVGFVYVMKGSEDGPQPAFDATNGYVRYERGPDADIFLFSQSSYRNYGAAPEGPYYDPEKDECVVDEPKQRRPGDQATITTDRYAFRYDGRWLMTGLRISDDGLPMDDPDKSYGPDVVDQWKARAFQQRPGGQTPCCGFEEEVNNWGGSSILMGERSGPVRTIRETWGADSGTNVVRREIFYSEEIRFGAFLRVHPIPPADGIYAQWDYNAGIMTRYYNSILSASGRAEGAKIDGKDDEIFGNSRVHTGRDGIRVENLIEGAPPVVIPGPDGEPAEGCQGQGDECVDNDIDLPDPQFSGLNAGLNWEQISGSHGSLVLRTAIKQPTAGGTPQTVLAVPYYRDDSCFDDGTGSDPGPHLHGRGVDDGEFATYTDPETGETKQRECWDSENEDHPDVPGEDPRFFQGSIGTHGVHLLMVAESDNAGTTLPLTEIDSEQRMVVLPGEQPNVGEEYGRHTEKPLVAVASPERRSTAPDASPTPSESPDPDPTPTPTDDPDPTPTPTPTEDPDPTPTPTPTEDPDPTPTPTPTEDPELAMPGCEAARDGRRWIEGYIPVAQDDPKDATTLHYQVWFPDCEDTDGDGTADFAGPYHAVMDYSGYKPAIDIYDGLRDRFLSQGYAVVGLNIRGTACSGGYFDYFEPRQAEDGREAIDFLTSEETAPWSTGRLAMVGKSYPGITQLFVAGQPFEKDRLAGQPVVPLDLNGDVETPEGLVAIVPGHVFGDLYRDVPYPGGIQNSTFAGGWSAGRIYDMIFHGPGKATGTDYEFQVPEKEGEPDEQCLANQAQHAANPPLNPFVRAVYNHHDGELFFERSPWYWAHNIEVPTFLIESWQDEQVGSRATELLERFDPDLEVRFFGTNGDHGEYYGNHVLPEINRFLAYHLAQEVPTSDRDAYGDDFETAVAAYNSEPPVQINWETGAEGGRTPGWKETYKSWPPPTVNEDEPWRLNLTGDGLLINEATETTGPDSVDYDYVPGVGTQQRGGYKLTGSLPDETRASWSEKPPEGTYAMFQTHRLEKDALLAGPASLDLWVSSTAPDTDFQVTMTEIRPDGKEIFVQQGWLRASHRKLIEDALGAPIDSRGEQGWSTPLRPFHSHRAEDSLPLTPGQPTEARIEIFPFAQAFREGSAIRIYVEAPHIKPDLWGFALLPGPARNTIHTGGGFQSTLALPLLDGETAPTDLPGCNEGPVHSPLRNQPCREAIPPLPPDAPQREPEPTQVAFTDTSAGAGQFSDHAPFEAKLADEDGQPISGAEIAFELSGEDSSRTFTATTDEDGVAGVSPRLKERPGAYQLAARYAGNDETYRGSVDTTPFAVEKEDTALTLTVTGNGANRTARAELVDEDTPTDGVAGRTIELFANGTSIGTEETDGDGVAVFEVPRRYSGRRTFEAVFNGDDYYLGSSDTSAPDKPRSQPGQPAGGTRGTGRSAGAQP